MVRKEKQPITAKVRLFFLISQTNMQYIPYQVDIFYIIYILFIFWNWEIVMF